MSNYNTNEAVIPGGYTFSNLTTEELKAIKDAEKKINEHHGTNLCLIAYDQTGKSE